jgi:hypothetical protein
MTDPATTTTPPIVCDMTDARDTVADRVAEYDRLFTEVLVGRERTEGGIRFRFRADPGVEDWVRDLAAREKACCAWREFDVTLQDGEVWWDERAVDEIAQQFLDDFYGLPDMVGAGAAAVVQHFAGEGQHVMMREAGALRPATSAELGLD